MINTKKIKIDLSNCSGYIEGEENQIIIGQLKKNGFYNKNYLYSVFNGDRIKQIQKTGNYREENPDSIFAFNKSELIWEAEIGIHNDIKSLCRDYQEPAIAVYDSKKFKRNYAKGTNWEYFFKNTDKKLEALLGIALLKF
ncbi:MAG: hypothetical protein AABW67_05855 [Nanoarchaeota archaeon]